MNLKISVLALLAIGMALVLLIHFCCIWLYGRFYISESNTFVLLSETTMIVGILTFSFYCFMRELTKNK